MEVDAVDAGEKERKDAKNDESAAAPEDPLAQVAVAAVVAEIAAELKRSDAEAEAVRQALERHWVRTMADYSACLEAETDLSELPALVRVKLAERVASLKTCYTDIGPLLEDITEETPEDQEQVR
jgi:hypothetical protein